MDTFYGYWFSFYEYNTFAKTTIHGLTECLIQCLLCCQTQHCFWARRQVWQWATPTGSIRFHISLNRMVEWPFKDTVIMPNKVSKACRAWSEFFTSQHMIQSSNNVRKYFSYSQHLLVQESMDRNGNITPHQLYWSTMAFWRGACDSMGVLTNTALAWKFRPHLTAMLNSWCPWVQRVRERYSVGSGVDSDNQREAGRLLLRGATENSECGTIL